MRTLILILICFSLIACIPTQGEDLNPSQQENATAWSPTLENISTPGITPEAISPTATRYNGEPISTPGAQEQSTPTQTDPTSTTTSTVNDAGSNTEQRILVDHHSLPLFELIPPEYIQRASQIKWLNRVASVGANISFGLDCLHNYFPDRDDPQRRPHACDRDLAASEIVYGSHFDRSNWVFEFHNPPPQLNPAWQLKVSYFIERVDNLSDDENYDAVSFDVAYLEDPSISQDFFTNDDPNNDTPGVIDLAALRERHPDLTFIWWTLALARMSEPYTMEFNQRMREYATENNLILIDIADIESHAPDGTPCTGIDRDGNPTDIPAICPDYTNEQFAGHLNSLGHTRLAKAVWILMAQVAGWEPPTISP